MTHFTSTSQHTTIIRRWLPLAFVATLLFAAMYGVNQRSVRSSANYPQVQLAQDLAAQSFRNENPTASLASNIDISQSLAPFVILYDVNGKPQDGNGRLNGELPTPPSGVFTYTAKHTEERVTWQPRSDTRIAAVIRYYQNAQHAGYVLAGRNLREAEHQQALTLYTIAASWAIAMAGSLLVITYLTRKEAR